MQLQKTNLRGCSGQIFSGPVSGLNSNINESGLNIKMTSAHGSNEQFKGNSDADSGVNTNDFSILIESIGVESVEINEAMDDSFALLSDFLSMHAAKEVESGGFRNPEHLPGSGTDN